MWPINQTGRFEMNPLLAPLAIVGMLLLRIGIPAAVVLIICKCVDRFLPEVQTGKTGER
jgi:hypothetical protein